MVSLVNWKSIAKTNRVYAVKMPNVCQLMLDCNVFVKLGLLEMDLFVPSLPVWNRDSCYSVKVWQPFGYRLMANKENRFLCQMLVSWKSDPSVSVIFFLSSIQMAIGVDKDCSQGRVYWSDISNKQIVSVKYDGTDRQVFIKDGNKTQVEAYGD